MLYLSPLSDRATLTRTHIGLPRGTEFCDPGINRGRFFVQPPAKSHLRKMPGARPTERDVTGHGQNCAVHIGRVSNPVRLTVWNSELTLVEI
jgi:hypothetical protein